MADTPPPPPNPPSPGEARPDDPEEAGPEAQEAYRQVLRLLEELRTGLEALGKQADAPAIRTVAQALKESDEAYGPAAAERLTRLTRSLESTLRLTRITHRELERELMNEGSGSEDPEISELPTSLARFIEARRDDPGFQYEVRHDPLRGWMVRWKEYGMDGTIRGSGQFSQLPSEGAE